MATVDEQQRGHVEDDLRGFIKGEILFDDLSRAMYSTDASIFQIRPLGVVVARDEEDVQGLVRYAAEKAIPLIPRGAGTGVAGESLGHGIIIDMSRHFRRIVEIGDEHVRVQPGVIFRDLNARLEPVGRRFAPDPASGDMCTVGGMTANNASGSRVLRHGYTRDHVLSLRTVLDNGDAVDAGHEPLHAPDGDVSGHWRDIIHTLAVLLEQNAELVQTCGPRTPFNRCGYLLNGVHRGNVLDLPKLLVGSEGTLGLFTEARLRTVPLPGGKALVLLGFDSLESALRAVQWTLPTRPAACELIDRRLLSLARGSDAAAIAALVPPAVEAVLLVEYEADSLSEARERAEALADRVGKTERLAIQTACATADDELRRLWQLREVALPTLYGLKGGAQPVAVVEDVGVPPERLQEYLHRVQEIMQESETTASYLVHAGAGQVHTRPFLDLRRPEDVAKLQAIAEKTHMLALDLGGTVSTQHGTGLARTPWVARQYGALYAIFRQIKAAFDPAGIFNPGKIVDPSPGMASWPLRALPAVAEPTPWKLRWDPGQLGLEAAHCNGCGHCRADTAGRRMCPVFHATHEEAASPRAKANLLRYLLRDGADGRQVSSEELRGVADLCVNCKMCAAECPAHVNIPKLMLEAKAHNVAEYGLDRVDWYLARSGQWARWGSIFALAANVALNSRPMRWVLERFFGLSQQRRLPPFASPHFFRAARRRGWTRKPPRGRPRVAYFVDTFAAYYDTQVAEATVAVLQHNGFDVYVPPDQHSSGAVPLAYGDVDTAREIASANLRALSDLTREGFTVVCSEPTAALMLHSDYLDLIDDADARQLAEHTVELTTFLRQLHASGQLKTDFQSVPLALGHHVPCHIKALGPAAGPALLALVPELRVHTIDVSCSGMAGQFGLSRKNYETSLVAGAPMLAELSRPRVMFGSTECGACRMQMEHGSGKRTLHPIQYLALAYGLMPEVSRRLVEPMRDRVLR